MVEAPYLMGIDFGTGGVRVGLFDRAGTPVVFRAETFPTQYSRPSWAEQDPGEWWLGLVTAVRGAVNDSGIAPRDIAGISVDATSCPGGGPTRPVHGSGAAVDGRPRRGPGPTD